MWFIRNLGIRNAATFTQNAIKQPDAKHGDVAAHCSKAETYDRPLPEERVLRDPHKNP